MASTQVGGAVGTDTRPFEIDVPQDDLDELRRRNLISFNEVDEGNHSAAWQVPDIFTTEVREAFRSLH